jgi:hypothetical protein
VKVQVLGKELVLAKVPELVQVKEPEKEQEQEVEQA